MKPQTLIIIIVLFFMVLIVCLRSCQEDNYIYESDDITIDTIAFPEPSLPIPIEPEKDINFNTDNNWPDSIYSSIQGYPFLTEIDKKVIIEVNKCRTNPSRYADEVLLPFLKSMTSENSYVDSNGLNIRMKEGRAAVEEAIEALKSQYSLSMLFPKKYLCSAASDHCADTGPKSLVGHGGSDGSSPMSRVRRYNSNIRGIGENIDYGNNNAVEIVRNLIIDDGVHPRGHRDNLFNNYKYIGVGFGEHVGYRYMCVLDFEK